MKGLRTRSFKRLWFIAVIFLAVNIHSFIYADLSYLPRMKVVCSGFRYLSQIAATSNKNYSKFERFFPCGGVMIHIPKIDYFYIEIGCGNYKDFRFENFDTQNIDIKNEVFEKLKAFIGVISGFLPSGNNQNNNKKNMGENTEKDYKKVFFARLVYSFDNPLNYLIKNPLNESKIDILIEFPVYYDNQWLNTENKSENTLQGNTINSNPYYRNINIIIVPIRFINRNFSARISILKININDITKLLGNGDNKNNKNSKNQGNTLLYLFTKGFMIEFVFSLSDIVDSLLLKI